MSLPNFQKWNSGDKWAKMSVPDSQENPWVCAATSLERAGAVKKRLKPYGITDPRHLVTMLAVLDQHGLFHEGMTPTPEDTSKEIWRRAKRMAKALWRRITNIRKGKERPADSHEADLAVRWEQLGASQMRLEEQKVLSEIYQINRGGRIIPRYASLESRTVPPQGRRSEPEITHALQILDRFLREECSMGTNCRMECLGDILRSATNLPDFPESVIERVRSRLSDAETKSPLHNVNYYEAIGVTYQINDDRLKMFGEYQFILNSSDTTVEEKESAESALEKLVSFH